MTLPAAIRAGLPHARHQGFETYQTRRGRRIAACVLGTAHLGLHGRPYARGMPPIGLALLAAFPELDAPWPTGTLRPCVCPVKAGPVPVKLFHVVAHLNDDHRWTRERIADWLEARA
jgi:hypothetical protein